MESHESWRQLRWTVTVAKSSFLVNRYRQPARLQNARHSQIFYVRFTFSDELFYLKMVSDELKQKRDKVTAGIVAEAHNGDYSYGTASLKQTA